MAGRRRTAAERAPDGSVRPTVAQARAQYIQDKMLARFAVAQTPLKRAAVAVDYLRSAGAFAREADPVRTEHVLEEMVRRMLRAGEELRQIGVQKR
jgi:hypothetical protein